MEPSLPHFRRRWRALALDLPLVLVALLLLSSAPARAEEPLTLAGRWTASPMTARWVIGDWGDACGPKPQGGGAPGGPATIAQQGRELAITGGGRTFRTSECWEQYPGLQRLSHSVGARSWKTVCKTPPGDPRQATITTTLTATDDTISLYETGQYQFVIKGQNCTASVGKSRTYTLVQRAGAPPTPKPAGKDPASEPAPAARKDGLKDGAEPRRAPTRTCDPPGPAARLEVRPSRKLLRAGEEFAFEAVVLDARGCRVRTQPSWSVLEGSEHAELVGPGRLRVREDAPEGDVRLSASVGGKAAVVTVEIASRERYEALLAHGGFDESGEVTEAATVAIASQAVGAGSAIAEDRATQRKTTFVVVVGAVALLLGLVGFVMVRRTRRTRGADDGANGQLALHEPAAPPVVPPPAAPAPSPKKICPVCGSQYPADSQFCGQDGAALVPLN